MNKFVICEEDEEQAEYLRNYLVSRDRNSEISVFHSGMGLNNALQKIDEGTIFIIDVALKELSGIEIAKEINKIFHNSAVIFISDSLETVTQIYDAVHCYFIYKKELDKKLATAINRAQTILKETISSIILPMQGKTLVLKVSEIRYIERVQRTSFVYCSSGIYPCRQNMGYFIEHLSDNFVQTHRSYIVNLNSVRVYKKSDFALYDGTMIPISRAYTKNVKDAFQEYIINKAPYNTY